MVTNLPARRRRDPLPATDPERELPMPRAGTRSGTARAPIDAVSMILRLQRDVGNAAVARALDGPTTAEGSPSVQRDKVPVPFQPVVSAQPSAVSLETGQVTEVWFSVDNFGRRGRSKVGMGLSLSDRHILRDRRRFGEDQPKERAGKWSLRIEGGGAGSAEAIGIAYAKTEGAPEQKLGRVAVPVTVSNPAVRAEGTLKSLEERRKQKVAIGPDEQNLAESTALHAAEALAAKAGASHGTEIALVAGSLQNHITIIEAARARGYLQAVGDLSAKGMDKAADYDAFGRALAGNLLWALSGVLPGAPLVALATQGLGSFFAAKWRSPSPAQTAIVGTIGAMLAQFSGGLPSTTSSSSRKILLETVLTQANSTACNALRRTVPEYLAGAVGASPPTADTSSIRYKSDLEIAARYALYGEVYLNGLNDGELPDAAKVQADARAKLLRQYAVASAALDDGDVVPTRSSAGSAEVEAAVDLIGGKEKLKLAPYELVVNQMTAAAADMGCTIDLDPERAAAGLAVGNVYAPVTAYRSDVLFGYRGPVGGWQQLFNKKVVRPDPEFDSEYYLPGLHGIDSLNVRKHDLVSAVIDGKTVYSAKDLYFSVRGAGKKVNFGMGLIDIPAKFFIRYRVKP